MSQESKENLEDMADINLEGLQLEDTEDLNLKGLHLEDLEDLEDLEYNESTSLYTQDEEYWEGKVL